MMTRTSPVVLICTVIAWLCSSSPLLAHMRLVYPEPRTSTDPTAQRVTLRAFDNYAFFMCADIELQGNGQEDVFNDGFEK
jgi:hypothetical protein